MRFLLSKNGIISFVDTDISYLRDKILPFLKAAGVKRGAFFGSFAKGQAKADSDLDVLIDFPKNQSLLDFVRLKLQLEESLKRKVDLVEYDLIKPAIRDEVLKSQIIIL